MEDLYKYPRTYHLPWSPGTTSDDRILKTTEQFVGKEIVVTEKCDGENTSMYPLAIHARSKDSQHHPSRSQVKATHGSIRHHIPPGWRISGENCYAKHSIHYHSLPAYFLVSAIYDENNRCLGWDEMVETAQALDLEVVPLLYRGIWDEEAVKACWTGKSFFSQKVEYCDVCEKVPEFDEQEGYVVRVASALEWKDCNYDPDTLFNEFAPPIAKYVRKGHVQTSQFWMNQPVVPNLLRE